MSQYQKGKTNLDFSEARVSEWQWHQLGKSASRSRQTTTPAPHHSIFYRPGALPAAQPTTSNVIYKRAQWSAKPNLRRKRRGVKWIGRLAGSSGS